MGEIIAQRLAGPAAAAAILAWMTALCVADLRDRRLPNALTLPGAAAIAVVAGCCGRGLPAVLGALALAGAYLVVHLAAPRGMGAGDVKLALGTGALTGAFGAEVWFLGALGAPLLTLAVAVVGRRRVVPHGPSMCLASAAVLTAAWLY